MLYSYQKDCQQILADLKQQIVNPGILTSFINKARGQIAAEGQCVRVMGTLITLGNVQTYPFSNITVSSVSGVSSVLNVRMISASNGSGGQSFLNFWPWEWFNRYFLCATTIPVGTPIQWTQYAQGQLGSLYLNPIPMSNTTLSLDTACLPIALVDDTTVEAIPYPWTDAVPFYALYFSYMSTQRQEEAAFMYQRYQEFAARARMFSTPGVLPYQHPQYPTPPSPVPPPAQPQAAFTGRQ
jgi:hypothetical protein